VRWRKPGVAMESSLAIKFIIRQRAFSEDIEYLEWSA